MLSSQIARSTKPFPDFIHYAKVIEANVELEKVYPLIGLPNTKEKIDIDLQLGDVNLSKVIHLAIKKWLEEFHAEHCIMDYKGVELFKLSKILYLIEELNRRFNKNIDIQYVGNKVILTSSIPSYDGRVLIKNGTDVFKLVRDLLVAGNKWAKTELVSPDDIKAQCKHLSIAFSSEGIDGAWDIATMSMRGVKSCMRWPAKQAPALVGSITDPCCGIIYLTNGAKTQYGSKMLFRSVVRIMMSGHTPIVMVDRLYSAFYKSQPNECGKLDEQIKGVFIDWLRKKLPNFMVMDNTMAMLESYKYLLPKPPHFSMLEEHQRSYRDSGIPYGATYSLYRDDILGVVKQEKKDVVKKSKAKTKPSKKTVKQLIAQL